jgi:murein DD-endopeptidase MepM/ murein hydrolase activator NlpD
MSVPHPYPCRPNRTRGIAAFTALALAGATVARADEAAEGSAAERRAGELGIGSAGAVRRLVRSGPTPAQLRAAGGRDRPDSLTHPLPDRPIGRGHGSGTDGYHKALDVIAPEGTPILAAESGLVVYVGDELRGYGNLVAILHPGGWVTYYAHCSDFLVRTGQRVRRGGRIARVGNTGISHGPHLHFELWMGGEKVDPFPFLRPRPAVPRSGPLPYQGHRVRRGETLASLSARYGVPVPELREANHLDAGVALRTGWQILVPRRYESRPDPEPPSDADDGTYVVRAGDTLSDLAVRFDIPVAELARWNDLADANRIRAGMVLVLGGEAAAPEEESGEAGPERVAGGVETASGEGPIAPPAAVREDRYTVRAGDTLVSIGRALGIPAADLAAANDLGNPDRLIVGAVLRVPDVGGGPAEDRVTPDGEAPPEAFEVVYVVRAGDSIWSIARRFGTSVRRVRALNPALGEDDRIVAGQRLRVPRER